MVKERKKSVNASTRVAKYTPVYSTEESKSFMRVGIDS